MNVSDLNSLKQAMSNLGIRLIRLRKTSQGFNDVGRPIIKELRTEINGVLLPTSKRIRMHESGHGKWIDCEYELTLINPHRVQLDDIIIDESTGEYLRVADVEDYSRYGTIKAQLTRLNSTGVIKD